jgi:hypothetical protein
MKNLFSSLVLLSSGLAWADPVQPPASPAPDESRINIMRAILAAKDRPFIEPTGEIKAMLLRQNPSLAAPDCGVRYKQLAVEGSPDSITLLVEPQGRCRQEPGMPPQWVVNVAIEVQR